MSWSTIQHFVVNSFSYLNLNVFLYYIILKNPHNTYDVLCGFFCTLLKSTSVEQTFYSLANGFQWKTNFLGHPAAAMNFNALSITVWDDRWISWYGSCLWTPGLWFDSRSSSPCTLHNGKIPLPLCYSLHCCYGQSTVTSEKKSWGEEIRKTISILVGLENLPCPAAYLFSSVPHSFKPLVSFIYI